MPVSTPVITAISPNYGAITGGTTIVITGTGFVIGANVLVNYIAATNIIVNSATQITCQIPANAIIAVVDVEVINPDTGAFVLAQCFTYLPALNYHTPVDVAQELKQISFPTNTIPSGINTNIVAATVAKYCLQTEARVNARIGLRYKLPISQTASPLSILQLQSACAKLTAGRVESILREHVIKINPDEKVRIDNLFTQGKKEIDEIINNTAPLADATMLVGLDSLISGTESHENLRVNGNVFAVGPSGPGWYVDTILPIEKWSW